MSYSNLFRHLLRPLIVVLLSLPAMLLLLSLQTSALVPLNAPLDSGQISRIEQLILESAPSTPSAASLQQVRLDPDELNLLLDYGVQLLNLSDDWSTHVDLAAEGLASQLSISLHRGRVPLYLNLQGEFAVREDSLHLQRLQVGNLVLPNSLVRFTLARLQQNIGASNAAYQDVGELIGNVKQVAINERQLRIALQWEPDLIARFSDEAQQLFISAEDQLRIIDHYATISEVVTTIPPDRRAVSLNTFLIPLFAAAADRSGHGGDPIAENRTLFQTLAIYVNNEDISQLLGDDLAQTIAPAKFIEVRLSRRQDLARHVVATAAISASAGEEFAQLLTTTKEAYDARYSSGFSFSDLTANSVGLALASLSTRDHETAMEIQKRFALIKSESDYMPATGSSQDGISEADFSALYTDRNSIQYQRRLAEIDNLIKSRPLFQGLL